MTTKAKSSTGRTAALRIGLALTGLAVVLGACKHIDDPSPVAFAPEDYRLRHPIAVTEIDREIVVFVGNNRGGLAAQQRADVIGLAQTWLREGTGAINVDVPVDTPNARAAADSAREIQALFAAAGLPPRAYTVRHYRPEDPRHMPAIRLKYPRIAATAGPCGLWPDDIGPGYKNKTYYDNTQYYNFGCAVQRNFAAMIENPSDLTQARPETPAYTARRTAAFDKYRKATPTTTTYPEADKAKLSSVGQ
ncbi:CpaD family pilus assembly protein [Bradyrhizobium lablabi]|uniref:CpaD family pilus assembly protein n=1 Tax=Bradyrhizobium lablabi TaxID=722472 RepID=UPI001BA84842|nr:CpaD family pilus assembly protein [Bradyrhizobium lablabi]MBR1122929.1 CpaD family pilus assembly protein [Bradyrhizobium lablabi]